MRTTLKPLLRGGAAAAAIAITLLGGAQQSQAAPINVFQELFLSLDVSGSIDPNEFTLYKQGYVNAFNNQLVKDQIASTFSGGGLAIAVGQWSTKAFTPPVINWRHITDLEVDGVNGGTSLKSFRTALSTMVRQGDEWTCVDCGMAAAITAINTNSYVSARPNGKVIDISTDGEGNTVSGGKGGKANLADAAAAAKTQRGLAEASGIIINGLGVGTSASTFLTNNVVTMANGANKAGFVQAATGFPEFEQAITSKLIREVGPGPGDSVPGPLPVLGAAAAFGFSRKLRRRINTANLHQS